MQDICAYIIYSTTIFFAAIPLHTALMVKLSRYCLCLAGWRECVFIVGCAFVLSPAMSVVHFAFYSANMLAQESALFLVLNIVIECVLLVLTLCIYRPLPLLEIPLPHQAERAVKGGGDGQETKSDLGELTTAP